MYFLAALAHFHLVCISTPPSPPLLRNVCSRFTNAVLRTSDICDNLRALEFLRSLVIISFSSSICLGFSIINFTSSLVHRHLKSGLTVSALHVKLGNRNISYGQMKFSCRYFWFPDCIGSIKKVFPQSLALSHCYRHGASDLQVLIFNVTFVVNM